MKTRIAALAIAAGVLAAAPAAAHAAPVKVNVRIEGAQRTLFDGDVVTDAETLSKDSTGPHACNGLNGGANTAPGATVTTALDAAASKAHLSWTASWSASFGDFLINSIGPDASTATRYWLTALNFTPLQVGGCQAEVHSGDKVLWYFGGTPKYLLDLTGPKRVKQRRSLHVKVIDGTTHKPIAGARVGGRRTNAAGVATLSYDSPGTHKLVATLTGSVRSNALAVNVRR